ncbi:hypothetical protein EVAR_97880_1 [Eumeta japonica]|uniref:Uncharacterized protein n=1 Tax=Eumeta variegata TaxID=151549 RepID=A0A4C1WER0_EUMVA|nr:hypothetical protein EVAR_97880_1 [Eumeta japonica]
MCREKSLARISSAAPRFGRRNYVVSSGIGVAPSSGCRAVRTPARLAIIVLTRSHRPVSHKNNPQTSDVHSETHQIIFLAYSSISITVSGEYYNGHCVFF